MGMSRHNYRIICRLYLACALLAWLCVAMAIERAMTVHKLRSLTATYLQSFSVEQQVAQATAEWFHADIDMSGYWRDEARRER